jgi:tRNA/rRNA methyltransferase
LDITFILVNPAVPENIGASARAIKTMGFDNLKLINPPPDYLEKARILAHGSADILQKAEIFTSFDTATAGYDLLIATSSKKRRTNEEYVRVNELKDLLFQKQSHLVRVALIFGGEESGLSNNEIKKCDVVSSIPIAQSYPSLNLSQAVMIYAYILSGLNRLADSMDAEQTEASMLVLKEKIENILKNIPLKQPHIIGPRIMEKISLLKDDDLNLLHSVCNAILEERRMS